jgi:hypothetical protein
MTAVAHECRRTLAPRLARTGRSWALSVGTSAWPDACSGDGQDRGAEARGVAAKDDGTRGGDHVVRLAQESAADIEAAILLGVQPDVESLDVVLQLEQGARAP